MGSPGSTNDSAADPADISFKHLPKPSVGKISPALDPAVFRIVEKACERYACWPKRLKAGAKLIVLPGLGLVDGNEEKEHKLVDKKAFMCERARQMWKSWWDSSVAVQWPPM
ncbi:hypothetical protein VTK26DRAFT_2775 [Humicola hyalothermophila]